MPLKSEVLANCYFDVDFLVSGVTGFAGKFARISGLGIDFDYEKYYEGGSMYPRFLFNHSNPQKLVMEQGVITHPGDLFSYWAMAMNLGSFIPAATGIITLKDITGKPMRKWVIAGAYISRYSGVDLDSNSPKLAVNTIEMWYGGVF